MKTGPIIAIRCETGSGKGFGHLSRMIGLAEVLARQYGARVRFLCDANPMVERFLRPTDFPYAANCGAAAEEEFLRLETQSADLLVIDTPHDYTEEFVRTLRSRRRVVFIDHCCAGSFAADLTLFPCAALSPEVIDNPRWHGAEGVLLHGTEFVLVSGNILELWQCRGASFGGSGPIVLTTGGSDPQGVMLVVLPWLAKLPADREINVLVGDSFAHPRELARLQTRLPGHVRIFPYSHDRLAAAAVAVCTFGVTAYELMFLGIPSLVIGHSVENAETSRILAERCRATVDLGYVGNLCAESFIEPLLELLGNQQRRRGLSQAGLEQIDGLGALRTAEKIIGLVS